MPHSIDAIDPFDDPNTLFGRLRAACSQQWDAYCTHEFVRRIGDATLAEESFRHYLLQDYLFLIHFSRAWALAAYKSESLADMRAAAAALDAHLNYEMKLHIQYCAAWGISKEMMEQTREAKANMAYTRYVLERGLAGDILDLHVALAPCVIGYAVIGTSLLADPNTRLDGNPYRQWIEMYADAAYQEVAENALRHLDALAVSRSGPARFDSLARTFCQATALEVAFWEMGLQLTD
jgi:thiaminase/transcriptional activator TenA